MNMIRFLARMEIEMMESVGCKLVRCDSTDAEMHFDCNWITKAIIRFDGTLSIVKGELNGSQVMIIGKICERLISNTN